MASVTTAGSACKKVEGAPGGQGEQLEWGGGVLKGISCEACTKQPPSLLRAEKKKKENLSPNSSDFGGQVWGRSGESHGAWNWDACSHGHQQLAYPRAQCLHNK